MTLSYSSSAVGLHQFPEKSNSNIGLSPDFNNSKEENLPDCRGSDVSEESKKKKKIKKKIPTK